MLLSVISKFLINTTNTVIINTNTVLSLSTSMPSSDSSLSWPIWLFCAYYLYLIIRDMAKIPSFFAYSPCHESNIRSSFSHSLCAWFHIYIYIYIYWFNKLSSHMHKIRTKFIYILTRTLNARKLNPLRRLAINHQYHGCEIWMSLPLSPWFVKFF